jgi:hypothetical protein
MRAQEKQVPQQGANMGRSGLRRIAVFLVPMLASAGAHAGDVHAASRPAAGTAGEPPLVLTAAPRESATEGERLYGPLAAYLATTLGRPVIYRHPGSWGVYRTEMVRGRYDLVFDGPHFNGYRAARLDHEVLVRLPEVYQFAIIGRQDLFFTGMQRLAGRTFCTLAPPNLGAQVLLDLYDNPARQPVLVPVADWRAVYDGVIAGRCTGGVLPLALLRSFDPTGATRILFFSAEMPHQALSAGPRVSVAERQRLRAALTTAAADPPTRALRAAQRSAGFVPARNADYVEMARYLRNEWGFY